MKLSLALSRLPKPDAIMHAVKKYDTRVMTGTLVEILLSAWPVESDLSEFAKEKLEPKEQWDKPEAFFM
jgi:hypothetical protein